MGTWPGQILETLRTHLPVGSRLLAAVSGGGDSVAMAHVLRASPYALVIGHVDHGLRAGSARDARFVRQLARDWDLPFKLARADVRAYARAHRLGLEEAARERRYAVLERMAKETRCRAVLTAHTADDQAETVLMNFLRGAGPTGLSGIPYIRPLRAKGRSPLLIRPLLGVRRAELRAYLRAHRLTVREDPSNRSRRFTRNQIRLDMLPQLERRFPGLAQRLVQAADVFREEERFWATNVLHELPKTVRKDGKRLIIALPRLFGYHKPLSRRILRQVLPGLSFQEIERLFTLARSSQKFPRLQLAGGWDAVRQADTLVVTPRTRGMT